MGDQPSPVFDLASEGEDHPALFDAASPFEGFGRDRSDTRAPRSTVTAQLCGDPSPRRRRPAPSDAPIQAGIADLDEAALLMLQALETLGAGGVRLPLPTDGTMPALSETVARVADRARSNVYLAHPQLKPRRPKHLNAVGERVA